MYLISFSEIIANINFKDLLKEPDKYYAHRNRLNKETLVQHINLTAKYFLNLVYQNKLEPVIDNIIRKIVLENSGDPLENEKLCLFIKELFIKSILYHDLGKINENFQIFKMENNLFQKNENIDCNHSLLSGFIFIFLSFVELKNRVNKKNEIFACSFILLFAYIITKHHSLILDPKKINFLEEEINTFLKYFNSFNVNVDDKYFSDLLKKTSRILDKFLEKDKVKKSFKIYALLKLNSSLLTASDYYATNEFKTGLRYNDFGVIKDNLREKIHKGIYNIKYNEELLQKKESYEKEPFENLQSISNHNINILRQKLSIEVLSNLEKNIDEKLFYIEAPTGSGKTNLSILCLDKLINSRNDITKIFYVFPFTTLITQTLRYIRDNLHLTVEEIAEIHSKASYNDNEEGKNIYENYINYLFVNYPICLISHVKFFNILTSNEKEDNYILHRVANSLVIIDEIQSYTPSEWDKINYLINQYSETFNITFILMSATLPKISKLLLDKNNEQKDNFVYLVCNKDNYFKNPNFKNRVTFNFDYLNTDDYSPENLLSIVYQQSEAYYKIEKRVKTIVEFVTKKSAHDFYERLKNDPLFDKYKKFILSGTIIEPRKKEIIDYLRSEESNSEKIIVVCTQVIEAGVDIDMDIGFKDKSIVDAEEQLAGRINRNAKKKNAYLFLFNSYDSSKTYKTDLRYKQHPDNSTYQKVLMEKDFDSFYSIVFERINLNNQDQYMGGNLSEFISLIKSLDFEEVHKSFRLIKDNTISIYVPLEIDIRYFSDSELKFMKMANIIKENENKVNGEKVWDFYVSIINNENKDFIKKKIDIKIISSILCNFTFNVWNNPKQISSLMHYSDGNEFKYGYLYLQNYFDIYSYEEGLKKDIETDCNFI